MSDLTCTLTLFFTGNIAALFSCNILIHDLGWFFVVQKGQSLLNGMVQRSHLLGSTRRGRNMWGRSILFVTSIPRAGGTLAYNIFT